MALTENDFASIKTMVNDAITEQGQTFLTSQVVKNDPLRKLVWVKELGDQPIPVIDFQQMVDIYSFAATVEPLHLVGAAGEPAFQNGWGNFASGYVPVAFYKDPFEVVHLQGLAFGGTVNNAIFTLPVGYRPSDSHLFATDGGNAHARVDIASNGNVSLSIVGSGHTSLSKISFRAATPSPEQIQKRSGSSNLVMPKEGETVLIAFERGTRRLPRCLGVIQSQDYIQAQED